MTARRWVAILRARWRSATIALFGVLLLALAITLMMPKEYTARASVILDLKTPEAPGSSASQAAASADSLSTQIELLKSQRVAEQVLTDMSPPQREQWHARWKDAGKEDIRFEDWIVAALHKGLDVRPSNASDVINVWYTASNPQEAAETADAFASAYLALALELRGEPARQRNRYLDDGARQLREQLESARKTLSDFRKNNEASLVSEERFEAENTRLNELSLQLANQQAAEADASNHAADVRTKGSPKEVVTSPLIVDLKAQLAREEAELLQVSSRLGSQHPEVLGLHATISDLRARLVTETARLTGSPTTNVAANRLRTANVKVALDEQRTKVQKLKSAHEQAAALQRDVEAAQRADDTLQTLQKASAAESQSHARDSTSRIEKALVPSKATSPRLSMIGVAALVLGCLAAVARRCA